MKELNKLNTELNLLLKSVHEYQYKHREQADPEIINQVNKLVKMANKLLVGE